MDILSKLKKVSIFAFIFNICLLSFLFVHDSSARILDAKGNVRKEVKEVFHAYAPIIQSKSKEILEQRGLSLDKISFILSGKTSNTKISLKDLNDIAQVVFLRPAGRERKDSQSHNIVFYPYTSKQVFDLFKKIGDINTVFPKHTHYDYILINGSTIKNMRERLQTLVELVKVRKIIVTSKTQIVFLTGERDLFREESMEQLIDPRPLKSDPHWKQPEEVPTTESQAAQWIWYQTDLPCSLKDAKIVFVKAQQKQEMDPVTGKTLIKRPTTFDTIQEWLTNHQPKPGRCISISNQPYVYYQQLTTYGAFKKAGLLEKGFTVEGVGKSIKGNNLRVFKEDIGIILDNFARTIYTEMTISESFESSHAHKGG